VRVLVLGGDGMLGHELLRELGPAHEVAVTLRQPSSAYERHGLFHAGNAYYGIDVRQPDAVPGVLDDFGPDAVVNAVGIIKQRPDGQSTVPCLEVNALFPHRLAALCHTTGARLVHLSTDCVFSGDRGSYREEDRPDPPDVYGMTKLLGEVDDGSALVLRSSIVGLELASSRSLVEWFLQSRGTVRGFTRAIYTGLTTTEMSRLVEKLLLEHPELHGLWHVASEPISKYDLLRLLASTLGKADVEIVADDSVACDRSLLADRLADAIGYAPPRWDVMLADLCGLIKARNDTRQDGAR
jgi:dTDP-4-dehydrorhamnose reductase